jgi:hypothetical protein
MPRTTLADALLCVLVAAAVGRAQPPDAKPADPSPPPPVQLTAQQDHKMMMELLKIEKLRPGASGSNRQAPNAANYDESKANPYPNLPDPLVLKSGSESRPRRCGGINGDRKSSRTSTRRFMDESRWKPPRSTGK